MTAEGPTKMEEKRKDKDKKSDWPLLVSRMARIKMLPATRARRRM